ncbi:uncharacterized protein LOC131544989 [Onychostoma macrolepis]|uniref:uncharacterized protein LOC131544989 n=1 Tax=Onychostoma macrolepis TaxID=369639 RepID=UPI00272C28BD|nr:uncharacterized protein LOC131544989 [Onychostoma macrolepis]
MHVTEDRTVTETDSMTAEERLWGLRQAGRRLEQYVEDFCELVHQLNWRDAALGACFLMGLDDDTIRCDLPSSEFPLIELINLVLFLNGSEFEVHEVKDPCKSRRPAHSESRRIAPAHLMPRTPTYHANGSDCRPDPKYPRVLHNTSLVLSSSSLPPPKRSMASPMTETQVPIGILVEYEGMSCPPVPTPRKCPPVPIPLKSPPVSPLVPSSFALPERPPVPTP